MAQTLFTLKLLFIGFTMGYAERWVSASVCPNSIVLYSGVLLVDH